MKNLGRVEGEEAHTDDIYIYIGSVYRHTPFDYRYTDDTPPVTNDTPAANRSSLFLAYLDW